MSQNSTPSKKKFIWIYLSISIFILLFIFSAFVDVEGGTTKSKRSWYYKLNIQKLGTALLQYSKNSPNSYFPKTLSELSNKYIANKHSFIFEKNNTYLYVSGFSSDLPHNVPILIEKIVSHIDPRGTEYAMVIYGDFQVGFIGKQNHHFHLEYMKKMQNALDTKDASLLLRKLKKELDFSKNIYVINTLLWKLGKENYKPALSTIKKCQKLEHPASKNKSISQEKYIYYQAKSIALQANYTLSRMQESYNKKFIQKFLNSKNYFHRKKAWNVLHPNKSMVIAISPSHIESSK